MTSAQLTGLAILIAVLAIVIGYGVAVLVPRYHFPRTAGVLASATAVGAMAVIGIDGAALIVTPWGPLSTIAAGFAASLDRDAAH